MSESSSASELPGKTANRLFALLFRPHFSPYKMYVRRDLHLAVVLNPKVGTTTFRHLLVDAQQETGTKPRLGRLWPLNEIRRSLIAPPGEYLDLFLHPRSYQFFGFIRNPYRRLLSAWKDKCRMTEDGDPLARSMRREFPLIREFARAGGLDGAEPGSVIPFDTFVEFVASQPDGRRNHHWDSQSSVMLMDLISYDRLYRIEDEFGEAMVGIYSRLGVSRDWIEHKLAKPLNQTTPGADRYYTEALADRVYDIYRRDFDSFGYRKDSWSELGKQ